MLWGMQDVLIAVQAGLRFLLGHFSIAGEGVKAIVTDLF